MRNKLYFFVKKGNGVDGIAKEEMDYVRFTNRIFHVCVLYKSNE